MTNISVKYKGKAIAEMAYGETWRFGSPWCPEEVMNLLSDFQIHYDMKLYRSRVRTSMLDYDLQQNLE